MTDRSAAEAAEAIASALEAAGISYAIGGALALAAFESAAARGRAGS